MKRIVAIDAKMTWEEFKKKFWGFFPTSVASKQEELLKEEYKRLTGRDVEVKAVKRKARKTYSAGDVGEGDGFSEEL